MAEIIKGVLLEGNTTGLIDYNSLINAPIFGDGTAKSHVEAWIAETESALEDREKEALYCYYDATTNKIYQDKKFTVSLSQKDIRILVANNNKNYQRQVYCCWPTYNPGNQGRYLRLVQLGGSNTEARFMNIFPADGKYKFCSIRITGESHPTAPNTVYAEEKTVDFNTMEDEIAQLLGGVPYIIQGFINTNDMEDAGNYNKCPISLTKDGKSVSYNEIKKQALAGRLVYCEIDQRRIPLLTVKKESNTEALIFQAQLGQTFYQIQVKSDNTQSFIFGPLAFDREVTKIINELYNVTDGMIPENGDSRLDIIEKTLEKDNFYLYAKIDTNAGQAEIWETENSQTPLKPNEIIELAGDRPVWVRGSDDRFYHMQRTINNNSATKMAFISTRFVESSGNLVFSYISLSQDGTAKFFEPSLNEKINEKLSEEITKLQPVVCWASKLNNEHVIADSTESNATVFTYEQLYGWAKKNLPMYCIFPLGTGYKVCPLVAYDTAKTSSQKLGYVTFACSEYNLDEKTTKLYTVRITSDNKVKCGYTPIASENTLESVINELYNVTNGKIPNGEISRLDLIENNMQIKIIEATSKIADKIETNYYGEKYNTVLTYNNETLTFETLLQLCKDYLSLPYCRFSGRLIPLSSVRESADKTMIMFSKVLGGTLYTIQAVQDHKSNTVSMTAMSYSMGWRPSLLYFHSKSGTATTYMDGFINYNKEDSNTQLSGDDLKEIIANKGEGGVLIKDDSGSIYHLSSAPSAGYRFVAPSLLLQHQIVVYNQNSKPEGMSESYNCRYTQQNLRNEVTDLNTRFEALQQQVDQLSNSILSQLSIIVDGGV